MTAYGVPGVYTFDFYDGWGANYMMWVAHMRNSIGRFYETQGAGDASTRIIRSNVQRQWHRPSTPLREVVWGMRNNVNLQQSAVLIAMHEVATNREEFLHNFYTKSARSVAKAHNEGPAAYVLPADDPRPGRMGGEPEVAMHETRVPRVAVMHTWTRTQNSRPTSGGRRPPTKCAGDWVWRVC